VILVFMFFYGLIMGYKLLEIIMLCVSLAVAAIPEGLPAVITITLSGGASALAKKKTIVRQMSAVETLGATDIICSDKTGTITQNKMKVKKTIIYNQEMFELIAALANETVIDGNDLVGDPTETCLFDYLFKKGKDPLKIRDDNPRITDAPFDSERKMMSSLNTINKENYILVKGSIENLIKKCKYVYSEGKIVKLSKKTIKKIQKDEQNLASEALRVIGFAYKKEQKNISDAESLLNEEKDLIYAGMAGIIDPPRQSVKKSVENCQKAGIRPVMITGDSLITACAIAKEVGIIKDESEGILGSELDKYSDEELLSVVKKYNVYARVSPDHNRRIVAAWQGNNKVVAMTGDGVNDAPAIKDAHVGVGMGITGTEVTKSVADIILLDDSFSTIVVAVEEGRRIFTNIRNNMVYSLSSNFAEIFAVLIGMFTGHTILLPIHILFIDLITDSIPSICLSFEKSENGIMEKQPRGIDKPMFTPFIYANIIFSAIIETVFVLITFFVSLKLYTPEIAMTLSLLSLVIQEILYAYVCRNLRDFTHRQGFFSNKIMNMGILGVLIIEVIVFFTPVGKVISIAPVNWSIILVVVLCNLVSF
ncbi:MAG: cation-translocating P-type ATPase, partial [Bacilli bacterium]|nr:cation-translocating P-type ATPase [Bacilli bacterium]